jgi:hypothetical protein
MTDTYRGWTIRCLHDCVWVATSDNYEADWKGDQWVDNGEIARADSRDDLKAGIDNWFDENAPCEACDGFGRCYNNADETSGQFVQCEVCNDERGTP